MLWRSGSDDGRVQVLKLAITGTDTGVGKTVVGRALLTLLRSRGMSTAAIKPVETGVSRGEPGSDHVLLALASGQDPADPDVCPVVFEQPVAPWVAAHAANREIDIVHLDAAFERSCRERDVVVVEGAGGLLVPLSRTLRFDDLFARWDLDLLIVAADRLGAINHTLLTLQAAREAGLRIRGVVLNQIVAEANVADSVRNAPVLRQLLPDVPVVRFPFVPGVHDAASDTSSEVLAELCDAALDSGMLRLLLDTMA